MVIQQREGRATVRSVLGDTREAEVHPGAGFPWISCPFCWSAVYLDAPNPSHDGMFVARDGRCANPWCVANPNVPIDAARLARAEAIFLEMAEADRLRNHEAAMRRIRDDQKSR